MKPFYTDPLVTLLHGDCIEVLATLEADSVDAVVTDPPYGLEFMGTEWDRFAGNGFRRKANPADVGRDDAFGRTSAHAPEFRAGSPFQAWCEQWGHEALRVTKPGGYLLAFGGTRTHHRLACALEDAGWVIRDELDWVYASGFPKGRANLKPAHEPIVLARKPGPLRPLGIDECRIGTADTRGKASRTTLGVMNDDGWQPKDVIAGSESGRWPSNLLLSDPELFDQPNPYVVGSGATSVGSTPGTIYETPRYVGTFNGGEEGGGQKEFGYGDSGGYSRFFIIPKADRAERERGLGDRPKQSREAKYGSVQDGRPHTPEGYEYHREARANVHPTVKPIDLMRHLVRLVTPNGGTVLDPFLGSGTTCLAASEEGFRSIGIEREAEYLEIAKGRLMDTPMGLGLPL